MDHFFNKHEAGEGWVSNSSFKCCKTFSFVEKSQSAVFLTDILQIVHNSQAVRLDAVTNDNSSSVLVWVIFQEDHLKKARKLIDKIEDTYKNLLEDI